ncbi:MAG: histidyl-tRNA synthetase [Pseudomonadota bacterium]|jgi:histidyl-tRNA synthetase
MAKQNAQPPKGTRDFLPAYVRQRQYAISIIRKVYESYGFEPLETPALERLEALSGKYGEEGDQLMFKVLLRGQPLVTGIEQAAALLQKPGAVVEGRSGKAAPGAPPLLADLGLRYDLTVPLARAYAANQAVLPAVFKRYQIQPVWRADTPGKGRYREFYQCDVDVVGSTSLLVEAEVAGAAVECVQKLGFTEFKLRLNHRALLRAVVERAGIAAEREVDAITAIDKLDKIGQDGVDRELSERGVAEPARRALLELLATGADLDSVAKFLSGHAAGEQAISDVRRMLELSQDTAAAGRVSFDLALARGLGYYTGCILELASPKFGGSLGGGGRYDNLIGLFLGKAVPACGFALGFERLLLLMEEGGLFPPDLAALDVLLASTSEEGAAELLLAARELRELGLRVSLLPKPEKPGKLRKTAEEQQARHAIWLESGRFQLWTRAGDVSVRELERPALLEQLRAQMA